MIVGPGGVGLGLGSCLHASGHAVHFVVRGDAGAHPLQAEGLRRSGIFGEVHVPTGAITIDRTMQALAGSAPDFLLVCTKTTATDAVAGAIGAVWHALGSEPVVVQCQNGWGNAERLAAHVPSEHIYNARVITGFVRRARNAVEVTAHADAIRIGSLFGEPPSRVAPLVAAIDEGGIPCQPSNDIEADLLAKLLYNCLLNPLGALAGVRYGELGRRPETRRMMDAVAHEIFEVLERTGHRTHWDSARDYLATFYGDLLPATSLHESSMLQDLKAQRPTEIDALNGAVVRMAESVGVPAPVNASLTTLIRAAESSRVAAADVSAP